tara:strand:- start:1047 stop:1223 length:177 start_codon:yes stop_codon:yes gene_type:complete
MQKINWKKDKLTDIYQSLNDLVEHSYMVWGEDDECGSRELGIRQEYRKMLDNLKQVIK